MLSELCSYTRRHVEQVGRIILSQNAVFFERADFSGPLGRESTVFVVFFALSDSVEMRFSLFQHLSGETLIFDNLEGGGG